MVGPSCECDARPVGAASQSSLAGGYLGSQRALGALGLFFRWIKSPASMLFSCKGNWSPFLVTEMHLCIC